MKTTLGKIIALLLGAVLGFFGVFVSVFADGPLKERILTIAVILLIYLILGVLFGWLFPKKSWKWGLYIGTPGSVILLIYSIKELAFLPYFILYIGLILIIACFGAYISAIRKGI